MTQKHIIFTLEEFKMILGKTNDTLLLDLVFSSASDTWVNHDYDPILLIGRHHLALNVFYVRFLLWKGLHLYLFLTYIVNLTVT